MRRLLILAAGNGTRNSMFTFNSALPKILQSVGDKTILESIISQYRLNNIDEIVIVTQSQFSGPIEDLLKARLPKTKATIVEYDETPGTGRTLYDVLSNFGVSKNDTWFINWSDILMTLPTVPIESHSILFLDEEKRHRNLVCFNHGKWGITRTKDLSGDICGVFYLSNDALRKFLELADEDIDQDFDVCLLKCAQFLNTNVHKTIDIGDYAKYTSLMMTNAKQSQTSRYFNKLVFFADHVVKRSLTEHGHKLNEIEREFYKKFSQSTALATLLDVDEEAHSITIERVGEETCQEHVNRSVNKASQSRAMMKRFFQAISTLHSLEFQSLDTPEEIAAAVENEFYTAVEDRVKPVERIISQAITANDIESYEGYPITRDFEYLHHQIKCWLSMNKHKFNFGICHGDTNTDNCVIDKLGNIRFIDPRGYFGKLKTLGLGVQEYDIAKFVYGLSGYAAFNKAPYIRTEIKNGNVETFWEGKQIANDKDKPECNQPIESLHYLTEVFEEDASFYNVLVGIIWLKLTSYIINDPMKSVTAYLIGNAILTREFAEKELIEQDSQLSLEFVEFAKTNDNA